MRNGQLKKIYSRLFAAFGPQHWWPGETAFEVAVGAILTQNTNWGNVERAIGNLRNEGLLDAEHLHRLPVEQLADLIRPAGYFNIKAKRLKNFVEFLVLYYGGRMRTMKKEEASTIRDKLLSVNGIGPETADSIILYALGKPVFVVDAYTKRVLSRHNALEHAASYGDFQQLFHNSLKRDTVMYNEFHALFVRLGKEHCRTQPICAGCPLEGM